MLEKPELIPNSEKTDESKKERELLEKMSRREFLKKLGMGAAVLGLAGIETVLSNGCATRRIGLKNEKIHKGLEQFYRELEDPNEYLKYLEDREFVIKNEIFDSYARTLDKRPKWLANPVGGYLSENYLDERGEVEEFRERLAKLGLARDEINFYESLFTSADLIIFRESILKENLFLKVLPHERFHKAIKHVSNDEYKMMRQAAQEIMDRRDERGIYFIKERYYKGKTLLGFYVSAAAMNWEDFYTYLAQGEFDDSVEQALKTDYSDVYELFNKIKESSKLKEKK